MNQLTLMLLSAIAGGMIGVGVMCMMSMAKRSNGGKITNVRRFEGTD